MARGVDDPRPRNAARSVVDDRSHERVDGKVLQHGLAQRTFTHSGTCATTRCCSTAALHQYGFTSIQTNWPKTTACGFANASTVSNSTHRNGMEARPSSPPFPGETLGLRRQYSFGARSRCCRMLAWKIVLFWLDFQPYLPERQDIIILRSEGKRMKGNYPGEVKKVL